MSINVALLAVLAVVLASGVVALGTEDSSSTPVQKVVQMLADMTTNAKRTKNEEQVAFAEFATWCSTEEASLKKEIKVEAENIQTFSAEISKLTSENKQLSQEIAQLSADVAGFEAESKTQVAQRSKNRAEFVAEEQDYSESIDALERAIVALEKENYDRPATSAVLLQLSELQSLPANAKAMVASFLEMMGEDDPNHMSYQAPEANAYEFQSSSIVELLRKIRDEFRGKLAQSQKEEMNSQHASDMVLEDLADSVQNTKKLINKKSRAKERNTEDLARNKKELAGALKEKADDEKTLSETASECMQKKDSFDEKQRLRTDEIEALSKAIDILSSDAVTGNAKTYLGLAQTGHAGIALLQVERRGRTSVDSEGPYRRFRQVRQFLASESTRLHSKDLALLAEKMEANPFSKVTQMIDAMITRLENEANADANHEGYCDKEMGKNKITRNKLSQEIDAVAADVDNGKATIMRLTREIATLAKAIAELDASMAQASSLRKNEKAKNAKTVEDATEAKKAVQAAVSVLKDFYAKASTATALVQVAVQTRKRGVKLGSKEWQSLANPSFDDTIDKGHQEGMQTFGETYSGQQSEAGGVLVLLEVIASDFSSLKADTEAAESLSQKAHNDFMVQARKDKATKLRQSEMNNDDKSAAEAQLRVDIADMKSNQDQLLAAERYHKILVPKCIDQGMTFDERMKARQEEINSLKEALSILNRGDISTSAF